MVDLAGLNPRRIWRTLQAVEPLRDQIARDRKEVLRELKALRRSAEEGQARLEQALSEHAAALAVVPQLRTQVERCVAAYQDDARSAARIQAFRENVDPILVMAHARSAVRSATLETDPYPHVVVNGVFPADVYDRLVEALPATVFFDKVSESRDEMAVPLPFAPAYSRLVWELFHDVIEQAVLPATVEVFGPALDDFIRTSWPSLGSWSSAGIELRVANPRLMLRRPGYVIKPHRDPRWGFLVALFYLASRDSSQTYGTQLYRLRQERDETHTAPLWLQQDECELVKDVPGIGNTMLLFLNSTGAHGASVPADAPPDFLRYVYQARFSPDPATKDRLIALLDAGSRDRWVLSR